MQSLNAPSLMISFISWFCIIIFATTSLITILALLGLIKLGGGDGSNHDYYLKKLFHTLVIEIIVVVIAAFSYHLMTERKQLADLEKQQKSDTLKVATVPDLTPVKPCNNKVTYTEITVRDSLIASIYATTDKPIKRDVVIPIPKGATYTSHKLIIWTKNGKAKSSHNTISENGSVVSVKAKVWVGDRSWLGPRNWIGAKLKVYFEYKKIAYAKN